jgi:Putative beta-barrel porin-2, OmpL-like. bbp2
MFYLDFYIPWIFEGMNIRIGRYISVPDVEAQLAPQNPMFTHSILYNFDPFTQTGIITTTQINKNWRIQLGISASNDTAPWSKDAEPAGTLMFQWISNSNKDSLYFGANSFNDGLFHYNNLQMYVAQYNHKFNDVINTNFEGYYMYQRRVPDLPRSGKFSYAPEWGIVNLRFFQVSQKYVSHCPERILQ